MLHIARKNIFIEECPLLRRYEYAEETLRRDFELTGGEWTVENGCLIGRKADDGGALAYSMQEFEGDVLLDFTVYGIPPCANDFNFSWHADGWDYEHNDASRGYIAGLNGWWDDKTGIEKYPTCKPWASTPLFKAETGRTYHIQAGSIEGHCFLFVDGQLIVEMYDPTPEELADCKRVGLGVYASHVKFGPLSVYSVRWHDVDQSYTG